LDADLVFLSLYSSTIDFTSSTKVFSFLGFGIDSAVFGVSLVLDVAVGFGISLLVEVGFGVRSSKGNADSFVATLGD